MNPRDDGLGARLRALPLFDPPAGGWLVLERRRRQAVRQRAGLWAMAASVTLAVIVGGWQLRSGPNPAPAMTVAALQTRSQALDQRLGQDHWQTVVWDRERAERSATLESQLALIDLQINYADAAAADRLWQDRLNLMSQLVQTRGSTAAVADNDLVEY